MNFLIAFIAFNIIVIVHELGHFIAAKKFGIKVLEFSLFLGPKLFSFQRGETTYSLRLIPLLAYVKMEGEEEQSDSERAFSNKPKYARAITAFAGPMANLLLAVVLMTIVFSLQGYQTLKVSDVSKNSPATIAGISKGDTIISYDGKKTYMPLDIMQFLYVSKGSPAKVEYIKKGETKTTTTTISPLKISAQTSYKLGVILSSEAVKDTNIIKDVSPGYPAEKAGMIAGDKIIKLNNTSISSANELVAFVTKNGEKAIKVTIIRSGKEVQLSITPIIEKSSEMYDIGFYFSIEKGNLFQTIKQSAVFTYSITRSVGYTIGWLVTGKAKLSEMMGPIGIVSTIGNAVQEGPSFGVKMAYLLQISALISIALGATNLLPFPMLDGSRILLIGIEAIRRKPMKPEKEAYISMIGFVLLILLGVYAAFNDIMRLING